VVKHKSAPDQRESYSPHSIEAHFLDAAEVRGQFPQRIDSNRTGLQQVLDASNYCQQFVNNRRLLVNDQ